MTNAARCAYGSNAAKPRRYAVTSSGSNGSGSSTSLSMSPAMSTRCRGSHAAVCPGACASCTISSATMPGGSIASVSDAVGATRPISALVRADARSPRPSSSASRSVSARRTVRSDAQRGAVPKRSDQSR